MRFAAAAQLPPALARLLASHGHQAEHVADIGNTGRRELLQYFIPLLPRIEAMIRQGERLPEGRGSI